MEVSSWYRTYGSEDDVQRPDELEITRLLIREHPSGAYDNNEFDYEYRRHPFYPDAGRLLRLARDFMNYEVEDFASLAVLVEGGAEKLRKLAEPSKIWRPCFDGECVYMEIDSGVSFTEEQACYHGVDQLSTLTQALVKGATDYLLQQIIDAGGVSVVPHVVYRLTAKFFST